MSGQSVPNSGPDELATAHELLAEAVVGTVRVQRPSGVQSVDALVQAATSVGTRVDSDRVAALRSRTFDNVPDLAAALRISVRRVSLTKGSRWWTSDAAAYVVRYADAWCAVIPRNGRLYLVTPDGQYRRVDQAVAGQCASTGWAVAPSLPDRVGARRDLRRIARIATSRRDMLLLSVCALFSAVLGMVVPLLSGRIVGVLIPSDESSRVASIAFVLILLAVATTASAVLQILLWQRVVSRVDVRATSALVHRLFGLPASFHRAHDPGELAQRISNLETVSTTLAATGGSMLAALSVMVGSLVVLLMVDGQIAVVVIVVALVTLGIGYLLIRRLVAAATGLNDATIDMSGSVFAMLTAIGKIHAARAERRLYGRWMTLYARQQAAYRATGIQRIAVLMLASIPTVLVSLVVVFSFAAQTQRINLGSFTSVTSAATQFAGGIASVLLVSASVAAVLPLMKTVEPIVVTAPDPGTLGIADPGTLTGAIDVQAVTFGYEPGNDCLHEVSAQVNAGQMVAIVGASGCGKSTLIKVMLGLEPPSHGSVLYDGRSLSELDQLAVRRQLGVVPQNASLATGSILENIVNGRPDVSEADAWEAAEAVGLAEDIRAMPMRMATTVSDGASTFSGGQKQRIMLARVLAGRPRIVVLDEATSALDNRTQAQVMESLLGLGQTRIVVAHRLSTIRRADRIIVVDDGRVVEQGTYDELIEAGGHFAGLAQRQQL